MDAKFYLVDFLFFIFLFYLLILFIVMNVVFKKNKVNYILKFRISK